MIAMSMMVVGVARAADCASGALPAQETGAAQVTSLVVRDVDARIEVRAADRAGIHVEGEACAGDVRLRVRDGVATLAGRGDGEGMVLRVFVPGSVTAISATEARGSLDVRGVAARVAVVSAELAVTAIDVTGLRVAYDRGDVHAEGLTSDLVVEHLEGALTASGVGGNVVTAEVSGPVRADVSAASL